MKSEYTKAMEKKTREDKKTAGKMMREDKKLADKQRRERSRQALEDRIQLEASTIVNGQPIIGGMRIMDPASEEVLQSILAAYDNNEKREVRGNNAIIPAAYQGVLSQEFVRLKMYGALTDYTVYINGAWHATLAPQGLTYFEDKIKAEEKEKKMQKFPINIGSIVATGSNFVLGDAVNSTFSVDNSVRRIESEIDNKGGEDSANLREILDEVKELIENMQESRCIPKAKGLFGKLTNHLEKHGWFYGEMVGLIGAATMQMLHE